MLMLVISASTAMALDRYSLQAQNGDEVPLRVGIQYYPEITMTPGSEPITEWTWTSSDEDVAIVWPDGSIMAAGGGKATLTGESKDGSGQTVKIKVYVPKVYTTDDSMTISSPDGLKFGYFMNTSGINQISTTGTCFTTEPLEDSNGIDMCKILPVKAGTGSIVFTNNGRKLKTVKITVKKSAFDPVSTPATDSLVLSALDGEAYAVVNKSVNIRSEANSDSKIVGHADKGDKLIVTKPFYSSKWHQINYDGKVCYVSAKYCDIEVVIRLNLQRLLLSLQKRKRQIKLHIPEGVTVHFILGKNIFWITSKIKDIEFKRLMEARISASTKMITQMI